jgi:predicted enzyme related to lactoylglutathione lyase
MSNALIHWELMVGDVEKAKRFYGAVFDWRFQASGPEYTLIDTGSPPGGGMMAKPAGAPISALNSYFQVADVDATLRRVVEAGGRVIVPRTEITGIGWFAMFLDPEGIAIAVLQPLPGM